MREKKYANIEDTYDKKDSNIEEVIALLDETKKLSENNAKENPSKPDKETDKLSLTREIKFKDLQEQIENDEKAATREIVLEPKPKKNSSKDSKTTEHQEEPQVETKKSKKTSRKKKEIEKANVAENTDDDVTITKIDLKKLNELEDVDVDKDLEKTINEDLYLTTAFKPARKRIKRIFKQIFTFVIVLGVIASLVYFVIYPAFKKYNISSKDIYIKNIDYLTNKLNNIEFISSSIGNVNELSFTLDTNDDNLKTLKSSQLVNKIEQDEKNDTTILTTNIIKDQKKAGYTYYKIEDELYLKITNSEHIIDLDEKDNQKIIDLFDNYNKTMNKLKEASDFNDQKYLITKYMEVYKSIINDNNITKNKEKLTIDNKEVSVTRYTNELNKEQVINLNKLIYEAIINDDKCLSILSEDYDKTGSSLKEELKQKYLSNDYEDGYNIKINIYVKNIDDFVGVDIEENGFRALYFYTADDYFDFLIDTSELPKSNITLGDIDEGNNDTKQIYRITESVDNNRPKVTIEYNGQQIIKLYIDKLTNNELIADYELNIKDYIYKGKIEYRPNNDNEASFDITVYYQDYYYRFTGEAKLSQSKHFTSIDKDMIIAASSETLASEYNLLFESLDDMGIDVEVLSEILNVKEKELGEDENEDEEPEIKDGEIEEKTPPIKEEQI